MKTAECSDGRAWAHFCCANQQAASHNSKGDKGLQLLPEYQIASHGLSQAAEKLGKPEQEVDRKLIQSQGSGAVQSLYWHDGNLLETNGGALDPTSSMMYQEPQITMLIEDHPQILATKMLVTVTLSQGIHWAPIRVQMAKAPNGTA